MLCIPIVAVLNRWEVLNLATDRPQAKEKEEEEEDGSFGLENV